MKENSLLKHRLELAEEKLNNLQKVNEVSDKNIFRIQFFVYLLLCQTIHDEFQALQLFSTQLERHNQDLEAKNTALRKDLTTKIEGMCNKYDEEIRNHEEFVSFDFLFILKMILLFRNKARDVEGKLNDATKDITLTSLPSLRQN